MNIRRDQDSLIYCIKKSNKDDPTPPMEYYNDNFESLYLVKTKEYFEAKAQEWINSAVPQYVSTAIKWLEHEEQLG